MAGEGQHDSWFSSQRDAEYDDAVQFGDNSFFGYSPMVLESSYFGFETLSEVDHSVQNGLSSPFSLQQENTHNMVPSSSGSRPLGLTLSKTPSLLNMLESKLSKEDRAKDSRQTTNTGTKKHELPLPKMNDEKLKASNFGASFLKIGKWQRVKRFEGDLVAKCYFAKKKLVWEVLEGGLKSKIEIQWCDILGIRAQFQETDQPGILEIELSQPPMFYHESDPKPRKHTCWQPCPDFTSGQALTSRRHYVTFPPGTLDRHYEKLLQCDERLHQLSQRPFPVLQSSYFPSHYSDFSTLSFDQTRFVLQDCHHGGVVQFPPAATQDGSNNFTIPSHSAPKTSSTTRANNNRSSACYSDYNFNNQECDSMDTTTSWTNLSDQGWQDLRRRQSPSSLTSQYTEPPPTSSETLIYDNIVNHLLNDSQFIPFDEQTLLAKVRSMCSLLDYSPTAQTDATGAANHYCNSSIPNFREAEYNQDHCYSVGTEMEDSYSPDGTDKCAYAQHHHPTVGSYLRSFNEELSMNCPYF